MAGILACCLLAFSKEHFVYTARSGFQEYILQVTSTNQMELNSFCV